MSFCSFGFLIFFPIVFILYYTIPKKYQWMLLLASSYYFYMCWKPEFIILIMISTCIDYFSARNIEQAASSRVKKLWLLISICSNLSILFFFKYFNFFGDNINALFRWISIPISVPTLAIILPVGISFYTFQTMSYTIEVYRGNIKAERHLGYFALFVTYFPQLVAGPIETPQNLLPQLRKEHDFSYEDAVYGIKLMTWGFFKKMVVADSLAIYVNAIYNDLSSVTSGLSLLTATFFFALQVYCDFGGYSDIARGCARMMGVDLMVNFKSPYFFSKSIKEYWGRNHISLSHWFTSYVYIPLGGGRCRLWRKYLNNMITFLLSGLWHGADWTFVIWGGLQSVYLNTGDFLRKKLKREHLMELPNEKLQNLASIIVTCGLSCFSLIFFRANNIQDAIFVVCNLLKGIHMPGKFFLDFLDWFGKADIFSIGLPLVILFLFDYADEKCDVIQKSASLPRKVQRALYLAFIVYITLAIPNTVTSAFIYFQF